MAESKFVKIDFGNKVEEKTVDKVVKDRGEMDLRKQVVFSGEKQKNLIPKITKMLDLVIGDEFYLESVKGGVVCINSETGKKQKFVMTEFGMATVSEDGKKEIEPLLFIGVLCGTYKIKKLPFNPKEGDKYFYISWNHDTHPMVKDTVWTGSTFDYMCYALHNVYRTYFEANDNMGSVVNGIKSFKDPGYLKI